MGIFSKFKPQDSEQQKAEKFKELEKMFGGDKEFENNAKATWLVSRGNHYGDKGMLDKALEDFEEALKLQPDHLSAHVSRAMVYAKKGDKKKAEQLLEEMPEEMKVDGNVVGTKKDILNDVGQIRIYTIKKDPFCKKAKEYLNSKNVIFEECDLSDRNIVDELVNKVGEENLVAPTFDINGTIIIGFDEKKLDKILENYIKN